MAEMHAFHTGVSEIARWTDRNKSTVSRKLRRNGRKERYGECSAQARVDARRAACNNLQLANPRS